jgi:RNA polymerase sigma-70 factor (ECF subfamily)
MGEEREAPTVTAVADPDVRRLLDSGDVDGAATQIVRTYGREVFGVLRAALGNDPDADEVFAQTCECIWRGLSGFRWQCSLRTWIYVVARNESSRYMRGARRHLDRRANTSRLEDAIALVRTETRSELRSNKLDKFRALRDELSVEDRTLLIMRVDRDLAWEDIARALLSMAPDAEPIDDEALRRESARLRKRFQLVRQRLAKRALAEGLLPGQP